MRRSVVAAVSLVLMAPLAGATSPSASFAAALSDCVASQSVLLPFNGAVAAGRGDAGWFHARGFADAAGRRAIDRDTPFRLASVGKLFTRVAIGVLVQEGRLDLGTSVRKVLPELPESFAPITIAQLLEHRSGVAAMLRPDIADADTMAAATTARDLVAVVASKPLAFEAGSREAYSNGGYLLLGAVIEAVSGLSYRAFVAQRIFEPLGMKASGFEPGPQAAVPMTRLTGPGQPPADTPRPRTEFAALKATSAGDALSSIADLQAFGLALIGDRLLAAPAKTAVFPRRGSPWRLGQTGGSVGVNAGVWVLPDDAAWLVVLSNFDPPGGEAMGQTLLPVLAGQACKASRPGPMRMPPA